MSFSDLGLSPDILSVLSKNGYTNPSPIQKQAIPLILAGRDVIACAETGTGKTAAFSLPVIQNLSVNFPKNTRPKLRVLVLTPTRELAKQVEDNIRCYSQFLNLKSTVIFGGVSINPQIQALDRGCHIVVATPGRLLDHVGQRTIDLSTVDVLILDEADRILDMGFIKDVRRIIALLPKKRQNLLFSATFSPEIRSLANELLQTPAIVDISGNKPTTDLIEEVVHLVDRKRKAALLSQLIAQKKWKQVLVFTRTKHCANRLCQYLIDEGVTTAALHGNKSQNARLRALDDFKKGAVRVLVATDIAARGIDIAQLPQVVNFELPNIPEDYVHRIGRTGRAGHSGLAMSLVCVDEHQLLVGIERLTRRRIRQEVIPGFEPDPSIKAEPILQNRHGGQGRNRPQGGRSNSYAPRKQVR